MTTLESKHNLKMDILTKMEQIDYLLDVANILEKYGDDTIEKCETDLKDTGQLGMFVQITGNQHKGSLYRNYLSKTENSQGDDVIQINSYKCNTCQIEKLALGSDSHMICPQCGEADIYFDSGTQGMSYEQEVNSEVNISFAYKRINHFNEWLAQFQAKESTHIPQNILDSLIKEFKKERLFKKDIT